MASVTSLKDRNEEIRSELNHIEVEWAGESFDDDTRSKWNGLNEELTGNDTLIKELEARTARLEELANRDQNRESEPVRVEKGPHFQTRKQSNVPDNPHDLEEYRLRSTSVDDLNQAYVDGAKKIIDSRYRALTPGVNQEDAQGDAEFLVGLDREVALRFISTGSKGYEKEFETYIRTGGRVVGQEMERAASLTTTAGGFAVPVELDTTLLLTNAGVVNPMRGLARVRQTNVNTVEFINTTGIVAGFGAEATEASDNAPVLAQPTVNIEKAFAFVPMSIEIAEDWAGIQADMALCFADAKNQLESAKFLTGLGHASHEPVGLIGAAGNTAVVNTATTAVFAVGDLFTLETTLGPRYRANASIIANRTTFQKVRQFASNGVNIWVQLQGNLPPELIGYPAYEYSSMNATPTVSGSTIMVIGDFNYFAIVDRVGMNVEFIPHLFGATNRFPTGQRGLYMYWRTSSQVLAPLVNPNAAFQSLKVL